MTEVPFLLIVVFIIRRKKEHGPMTVREKAHIQSSRWRINTKRQKKRWIMQ